MNTSELSWRFEGGAVVRFPVASWVRLGDRPAALTDLSLDGADATVSYERGGLFLRLRHALDPRSGALVQTLELEVHAGAPALLLEFRWFGSFGDYGKGNLWKVSVVLPKAGFLTAVALLGPFP